MKNGVWEIVPTPSDKSVVTSKWIYKTKHYWWKHRKVQNEIRCKGFLSKGRHRLWRNLFTYYKIYYYNIFGFVDCKNGVEYPSNGCNPEGFEINSNKTHVHILKKSLYGLKQAPRAWYTRMDAYLLRIGFVKSTADPNIYIKVEDNESVMWKFRNPKSYYSNWKYFFYLIN